MPKVRLVKRIASRLLRPTEWYLRRYIRNEGGRLPADCPRPTWMNSTLKSLAQVEEAMAEVDRCGLIPRRDDRPKNWDALSALNFILARTRPDARILEVGALYSVMLLWLYQCGYRHLCGIDLTFERQTRKGPIVYEPGDLTHTRFSDASFDVICSMSVIEHGIPAVAYFREMARLLSAGGYLITSTDYWKEPVDTHGQVAFGAPIKIFARQEIEQLLETGRKFSLVPTGAVDLECRERAVTWRAYNLDYTFVCFAMEKTG